MILHTVSTNRLKANIFTFFYIAKRFFTFCPLEEEGPDTLEAIDSSSGPSGQRGRGVESHKEFTRCGREQKKIGKVIYRSVITFRIAQSTSDSRSGSCVQLFIATWNAVY